MSVNYLLVLVFMGFVLDVILDDEDVILDDDACIAGSHPGIGYRDVIVGSDAEIAWSDPGEDHG